MMPTEIIARSYGDTHKHAIRSPIRNVRPTDSGVNRAGTIRDPHFGYVSSPTASWWDDLIRDQVLRSSASFAPVVSNQLLRAGTSTTAWLVLLALSAVAALALSTRRRGWDDVFGVAVCAAALPASFVMLEVVNNAFEQGGGQPVGRHLLAILPFAMIGLAGSLGVVVTRRWLPAAVGLVVTIALFLESRAASDLVQRAYLSAVHDDALAPVVDQTWSDRVVATPSVSVVPSCPVTAFWLGFSGPPPRRLVVRSAGRSWTVPAQPVSSDLPLYDVPTIDTAWYRLPTPLSAPFSIALPPGAAVDASATDRSPCWRWPASPAIPWPASTAGDLGPWTWPSPGPSTPTTRSEPDGACSPPCPRPPPRRPPC